MKKIFCELCDGTEFAKEGGMFICQGCGTKYSAEEAKALMKEVEGEETTTPVSVAPAAPVAPVAAVQNIPQIDNLLTLAKSSFDSLNYAQAENFCNQIIAIDSNNYAAWKLKGEAINYQINAKNPRIVEVYNCIMNSYRCLDDNGKEENKYDILESIKTCLEGEIDFWLNQIESERPTQAAINKVKKTFESCIVMANGAFEEMKFETSEGYKTNLKNYFISAVNVKVVDTWNSTVAYNYYRDSLTSDPDNVSWKFDDYRPNNEIFSTFIEEGDNLIELLLFAASFISKETEKDDIITTYENAIFINKHLIKSRSYKRMVSTTTNGYGAVTDRREYWDWDRNLTQEAINIRKANNEEYVQKIGSWVPEYITSLNKKNEIEQKINALNYQINSLVTTRQSTSGCAGAFFLITGIIMFVLGFQLMNMDDQIWPFVVAIPEIIIGTLFLIKKPSEAVVNENCRRKDELLRERDALEKQLKSLR